MHVSRVRSGAMWAGTVAVMAAVAGPGSASASTPGGPTAPTAGHAVAKSGQLIRSTQAPSLADPQQAPLLPVAQNVADQARTAGSDIAGVQIDPASKTVIVYRTDPQRRLGITVPAGVNVVVRGARFSRTAMVAASSRLTSAAMSIGRQSHVTIDAVGPNVDGSGVTVSVLTGGATAATSTQCRAISG